MRLARCGGGDVERLAEIRATREQWMLDRGIDQWGPGSLPRAVLEAQVGGGEWFQLVEAAAPVPVPLRAAARLLDEDPDFWGEDVAAAVYVHGLMVDPEAAGLGLGEQVLVLAEEEARRRGRDLLRLDCAPQLVDYYERLGFRRVREKSFPQFVTILLEKPVTA